MHVGNSMPNQHKKMSTPSDFNEAQEICSLPQDITSHNLVPQCCMASKLQGCKNLKFLVPLLNI